MDVNSSLHDSKGISQVRVVVGIENAADGQEQCEALMGLSTPIETRNIDLDIRVLGALFDSSYDA